MLSKTDETSRVARLAFPMSLGGGPPWAGCHEGYEEEIAFGFRRRFESKEDVLQRLKDNHT